MKIQGRGYIKNGDVETYFRNHFVSSGLELMTDVFNCVLGASNFRIGITNINVGTNQSTPTTFNTGGLVSPVSSLINPTQTLSVLQYNGSQATIIVTDQYPISALPQVTIGEIGLYGSDPYVSTVMMSRASVADGDFSAFAYNPANSLVIQWNLIFTFV